MLHRHLYNLTLSKPQGITAAVYGNFSAAKAQEIIVSRGKVLELLRPDENGKMQVICSTEVFGVIRSIAPFRLTGGGRDYLIMGSDSGRIVILEYSKVIQACSDSTCMFQKPCPVSCPQPCGAFVRALTVTAGCIGAQPVQEGPPGDVWQVRLPPYRAGAVCCDGPQGPRLHDRGGGEAEAGICAQPRWSRQFDHLLAAGRAQVPQPGVLHLRHGHGLRQPGVCGY